MRVYEVNMITDENLSGLWSTTVKDKKEDDMEYPLLTVQLVFLSWVVEDYSSRGWSAWFVAVYKEKKE